MVNDLLLNWGKDVVFLSPLLTNSTHTKYYKSMCLTYDWS